MNILISEIESHFYNIPLFLSRTGGDTNIQRIAPIEHCQPGDLVFVDRKEFLNHVIEKKPSAVVIDEKLVSDIPSSDTLVLLTTKNVPLAHALVKQHYSSRDFSQDSWDRVHPSATIHPSVEVPDSAHIGPQTVISKGVTISANCRILAGAVIEHNVQLGKNCIIYPNAVIGYNCILGNNVEIGPGSILGSEGFGFAQDEKRKSYKIPQTGNVVLGNDIRIGAGNCIDRGSYGSTYIGDGTKTDNLCHIAHNVKIGQDCLLTAMFCIAGSSEIGDRVITSGQTGIIDHMKVCDDVVLLHRAGVTKNIEQPGMYAALPTQPLGQYMKNTSLQRNLTDMNKKIKSLEKQIQSLL